MKKDRFLLVIVLGAVLLIGIALLVVLLKPDPTYLAEDSPEGVAHNYLLALELDEQERAYSYLSKTLAGYPADLAEFIQSIDRYSWTFRSGTDTSLAIDSSEINDEHAVVTVRETRFYNRGLFESSQSISTFDLALQLESDQWKIIDAERYFAWCWDDEGGCRY